MGQPIEKDVRKIQQSTNGSMYFYIPKDIIEAIGLEKGSYVKLTRRGNRVSFVNAGE